MQTENLVATLVSQALRVLPSIFEQLYRGVNQQIQGAYCNHVHRLEMRLHIHYHVCRTGTVF